MLNIFVVSTADGTDTNTRRAFECRCHICRSTPARQAAPYSLLSWARLTEIQLKLLVATELFRILLVATHRNGEYTVSATSLSSFLKSKSQNNQLMMKLSWRWWLNVFFALKSCILYFIFFLNFPWYLFYFLN